MSTSIAERASGDFRVAAAANAMSEQLAVVKPLYAVLSPEQKRIADELFASRGGRVGGNGMRGMGPRA